MSLWYTRTGTPRAISQGRTSPALLFLKWHGYDRFEDLRRQENVAPPAERRLLDHKESRPMFLDAVGREVNDILGGSRAEIYEAWHTRYFEALEALGVRRPETVIQGRTLWRLVSGLGTNPALEIGLYLHPLYGFPYLPGSSVRGMVRHVAEMELLDEEVDPGDIKPFLDRARLVKALLGSLTVEPPDREPGDPPVTETARRYLARLREEPGRSRDEKAEIDELLNEHTGGMVTFYDAVPLPRQSDVLSLDVINPHYPDYYNSQGATPPSDDQNPKPIFFLTVSPEIEFSFPFCIEKKPTEPFRDPAEEERARNLGGAEDGDLLRLVQTWITQGLTETGAGAKTSSGYGYFELGGAETRAADLVETRAPEEGSEAPVRDSLTRLFQTAAPRSQAGAQGAGKGKRVPLEVVAHEKGRFILRDPSTNQKGIEIQDRGFRWEIGTTVWVRVVKRANDGRILVIQS
jgi:CRISPR-associated protein Cmr6